MPSDLRLPIKVVVVRDEDYRRPESTGGQRKLFGEVTPEIRDMFVHQIEQVGSHFADVFRRAPAVPAVARIVLKEKPENVQSTAVDARSSASTTWPAASGATAPACRGSRSRRGRRARGR